MKKNMLFVLTMALSFSSLTAFDSYLVEPEVAVKMINSKNIQFISIGKEKNLIVGTQRVELNRLLDIDIVGNMKCEPFLICPRKLKNYLENKGIASNQELILYDNQYGINAATLYFVLEAIGHKKIKILNGGYKSIQQLDPNKKIYDKYLNEKKTSLSQDNNGSNREKLMAHIKSLNNKLSVLEPLLLVKESNIISHKDINLTYNLDRSKFNFDYLIDRDLLQIAVNKVKEEGRESNVSILDACSMVDIVGNAYGSYVPGVYSVDWKEIINIEKQALKSKELLNEIFTKRGLDKKKDIYVYCMSSSKQAFYMALALREAEYKKVKVFSGDWNVWKRDFSE